MRDNPGQGWMADYSAYPSAEPGVQNYQNPDFLITGPELLIIRI
jgi:hypothetical protein